MTSSNMTFQEKVKVVLEGMHEAFGGRDYSAVQVEIIERHARQYGIQNFVHVANRWLENGTKKPFPIDFKNALQNLPSDKKPEHQEPEYKIQCGHCLDSGVVFMKPEFVTHENMPVLLLCDCLLGKQKSVEGLGLPRIDASTRGFISPWVGTFELAARRSSTFKEQVKEDPIALITGKVDLYKMLINSSRYYWKQQSTKRN